MTIDQMIEVMQAYKNGAKIESRHKECEVDWFTAPHPQWDWFAFEYRVKKEPVRLRLYRYNKNDPWSAVNEKYDVSPDAEVITVEQIDV